MSPLIFSQTAIFRLQRLVSQYYHQTGERYKLGNESSILELLQSSASIRDPKVRSAYIAFLTELGSDEIDALAERGVKVQLPNMLH
jgi:hypothetical protein